MRHNSEHNLLEFGLKSKNPEKIALNDIYYGHIMWGPCKGQLHKRRTWVFSRVLLKWQPTVSCENIPHFLSKSGIINANFSIVCSCKKQPDIDSYIANGEIFSKQIVLTLFLQKCGPGHYHFISNTFLCSVKFKNPRNSNPFRPPGHYGVPLVPHWGTIWLGLGCLWEVA